ncbi:MAG: POTRA domain-containing protein, partial [Dokdonella sp.]
MSQQTPTGFEPQSTRRLTPVLTLVLAVALAPLAHAAQVSVQLEGLSGDAEASVVDALEIDHYKDRQVSRAQVRRLYARAEEQIRTALEPYGFYNVVIDGELKTSGENFIAVLKVTPGPPTVVKALGITLSEGSEGVATVDRARARFEPHLNQSLDHAAYERSKGDIQGALFGSGFLRAELTQHEVRVTRATNTAEIDLHWNVGERYRFGTTTFEGGQFPDSFLDRYIPWTVDQYYSSTELLALQQALVDADYFSIAQVQPDVEHAADGRVPIKVMLAPAKRTVYTGGVFYGTDTGAGVRGDVQRRWINQRGHKLGVETVFAERLTMVSTRYTIPLPGRDNHTVGFGFAYRDENTATSQSKTFRLAATDTRLWHAWIRTIGLQFLTGDFKVAEQKGNTTLLY